MSILGNILNKIFHSDAAGAAPSTSAGAAPAQASPTPVAPDIATPAPVAATASSQPAPVAATASSQSASAVDVGAVLDAMAAMTSDHGGNYRTSIVDLLKLLDIESSLAARKALADELGVDAGADGSAEQNIALHRAVMDKIAENGGVVPDSLRQ